MGQGHQKTPSFISALVEQAVDFVASEASECGFYYQARGGITDVGKHTGGLPRETCWPLVKWTMNDFFSKKQTLWRKFLLHLNLYSFD
jgi:hypothetical protein